MSTYCMPDTVLGTGDAAVNKTDTNGCPRSPSILVGGVTGVLQEARPWEVPGRGAPEAARLGAE